MQDPVIIKEIHIARHEPHPELMRIPIRDLLERAVRSQRLWELRKGAEQRAREMRMPAEAVDLLREARRRYGDSRGSGLVLRRGVHMGRAADSQRGSEERCDELRLLVFQCAQDSRTRDEGVFAVAFQRIEADDAAGQLVEGLVDVGEQELRGVEVGQHLALLDVLLDVRRHVIGQVRAAPRVHKDAAEDLLEDLCHEGVFALALVRDKRRREVGDFQDPGEGLVHEGFVDAEGDGGGYLGEDFGV